MEEMTYLLDLSTQILQPKAYTSNDTRPMTSTKAVTRSSHPGMMQAVYHGPGFRRWYMHAEQSRLYAELLIECRRTTLTVSVVETEMQAVRPLRDVTAESTV
jgi:hypothetical protein